MIFCLPSRVSICRKLGEIAVQVAIDERDAPSCFMQRACVVLACYICLSGEKAGF